MYFHVIEGWSTEQGCIPETEPNARLMPGAHAKCTSPNNDPVHAEVQRGDKMAHFAIVWRRGNSGGWNAQKQFFCCTKAWVCQNWWPTKQCVLLLIRMLSFPEPNFFPHNGCLCTSCAVEIDLYMCSSVRTCVSGCDSYTLNRLTNCSLQPRRAHNLLLATDIESERT